MRGSLIAGKYELHEQVGEGGMAVVWRATMYGGAGAARIVAVKKLRQKFDATDRYVRMFMEEARVGSELAHPNIVQVIDFCSDESGAYYLVMEWVEGLDLAAFVNSFARFHLTVPWESIAAVGIGILHGLAAAHERRRDDGSPAPVIHRDVSPHNIILAASGVAKLTDFGLARARDRLDSFTDPGVVKGKLGYLAPEVAGGGEASVVSDLFAMSVVLWESLAAQRLFHGKSPAELFRKVLAANVIPIEQRRHGLPPRLVAAIHRGLARDPTARFQSAREMATELAELLREQPSANAHRALSDQIRAARERLEDLENRDQAG